MKISYILNVRSSRPEVFCEKCVLRNFAKFTGKHLWQNLFLNKVAGGYEAHATLLKKRFWHRCFPVNFSKFLRTLFFKEHLCWLLLNVLSSSDISALILICCYAMCFKKEVSYINNESAWCHQTYVLK